MTTTEPTAVSDIGVLISSKPGVMGGRPCIDGHRIAVEHVAVWWEDQGWSVAQIIEQFPQLTPAKIHAALAYYYQHKDAIRAQMKADAEFVERMKAAAPPSRLRALLDHIAAHPEESQEYEKLSSHQP